MSKANYYPRLETEKSFAVGFSRNIVHFIPKKSCVMSEVENEVNTWDCILPDWLLLKSNSLKEDMVLLYHENKMNKNNTTDFL